MATKQAKLPTRQLAVLAIARFAEPVASTSVNPYLPEMIASFNVPTDKIGSYSGWLASVFSLSQCLTGVAWGRASDKVGRKPMILIALVCTMATSIVFGFSTSLATAFFARSLQGASSGNVGILRTCVAELVTDRSLQPRAFSIMPLVWNVGSIFGPSIGGFLSNPQRHGWFTHSKLLTNYPYALPNLTISILFLIGIMATVLFLEESHEEKANRKDYGLILGSLLTSSCSKRTRPRKALWKDEDSEEADPFLSRHASALTSPTAKKSPQVIKKKPSWASIFSRQSSINLVAYTGLAMHAVAFDQLVPVYMHHPVQARDDPNVRLPLKFAGGFGLDSGRIGILYTCYGIFGMAVQFLCFAPLARRFGALNCFKACTLTFPFVYIALPFTSLLPTSALRQGVCLTLLLIKCVAGVVSFPCSTILLTNSAASLSVLGTLNGVATSISAAGRAAGPALAGWAFTVGVDIGYGVLPWWTLSAVAIIAAFPVWWLVEMDGFGGKSNQDNPDDGSGHNDDDLDELVPARNTALDISGPEDATDLVPEQMPDVDLLLSSAERRQSSNSLGRVLSPTEDEPTSHTTGSARENSMGIGMTRSGLGT